MVRVVVASVSSVLGVLSPDVDNLSLVFVLPPGAPVSV